MKIPKIDFTYLLYFVAVASVLSCMMMLTCESCHDTGSQTSQSQFDKPTSAKTGISADSALIDSILSAMEIVSPDSIESEANLDSINSDSTLSDVGTDGDKTLDEKEEERKFIKEHFVEAKQLIPDLIEEIRYNTNHNFVGSRINGYEDNVALMTLEAAKALKDVAEELRPKGYRIKIYDAYRPLSAVEHFQNWVSDVNDTLSKQEFYPDKDKSVLFKEGYISSRSRHCNGSTIDMTLCNMDGKELDMGGTFDLFSERSSPTYDETLTETQLHNRNLLRSTMEKHGFICATTEWWHYRLDEEPFPDKGFNFPVAQISKLTTDPNAKQPAPANTNRKPQRKKKAKK